MRPSIVTKAIAAALILAASSIAASAASAPSDLPLTIERLRAYALAHVNHVSVAVSGASVQGTSWAASSYPQADGDPIAIDAQASKLQLSYSVLPNEKLTNIVSWNTTLNGGTYTAFLGAKDFTLVPGKGGDVVPASALQVDMELIGAYIPVPGISYAWFNYRGADGYVTDSLSLGSGNVHDGLIAITPDMLRPNAELNVVFADGTRAIYGNGGQLLALETIAESGLHGSDPLIRVAQDDSTTIACTDADQVVRVRYTKAVGTVGVTAISQGALPDWITVVEKTAFDADPSAAGATWVRDKQGPPLTFAPKAGQTWLVLIHREPVPKGG